MTIHLGKKILILMLLSFYLNCNQVLVRVDDYESNMGGKNAVISVQKFPVFLENNTISGIQKDGTTTAVIFKDETNKFITKYSNTNRISMFHIEKWDLKRDFKSLDVKRYFYSYSLSTLILKFLFTIPTFGYIWGLPHETYLDEIQVYNTEHMVQPGAYYRDFFEKPNNADYSIMLTITNNGDIPILDEFIVVDVLPNYLEFESVEYLSNGDIKEVAYDLHKNENSQVIPFRIKPFNKGLKPWQTVQLKIRFKPILHKFKIEKYNLNTVTLPPSDTVVE